YLVENCFPNMRVLPLFSGPSSRPSGRYEASADELLAGMQRLFLHWIDSGARIEIAPLSDYLQVAIRRLIGVSVPSIDRRVAEGVFIVNTDGGLYLSDEGYSPDGHLGNLFEQSLAEIFASARYAASLDFSE